MLETTVSQSITGHSGDKTINIIMNVCGNIINMYGGSASGPGYTERPGIWTSTQTTSLCLSLITDHKFKNRIFAGAKTNDN